MEKGDKVINTLYNIEGVIEEAYKEIIVPSEPIYSFGFYMRNTESRRYLVHQLQCNGFRNQSPIEHTKLIV